MARFNQRIALIILVLILALSFRCKPEVRIEPFQRVAALNKPAVVLIYTSWTANVVGKTSREPIAYLSHKGKTFTQLEIPTLEIGSQGSGFVVNPDGYILTNAHVVHMSDEELETSFYQQFVQWGAKEFPPHFVNAGYDPWPVTEEDLRELWERAKGKFEVINIKRDVVIAMGASVSGVALIGKGYHADVRRASPREIRIIEGRPTPYSGKDVAVIKIEGRNLSTVTIGDSDEMVEGEKLLAIGYPGAVVEHIMLAQESMFEASVTSGIVSATRSMPDGSPVLQTDAAITHGNSGGPVFNEKGEVIGIATFGSAGLNPATGEYEELAGFNFLVPSNVAKDFLREIGVENKRSATDEQYEEAMELYWRGRYSDAIERFEAVLRLYPGHPYAQEYIRKCQEEISK